MDRFSPIAPAFIGVLLLPIGRVERERFLTLLERLRREASVIPLSELRLDGIALGSVAPTLSAQGSLLYNYTAAIVDEQSQFIAPFELFRQPLLVLGIVDGLTGDVEKRKTELLHAAQYLRERHPRVVHRCLVNISDDDFVESVGSSPVVTVRNPGVIGDSSLTSAVVQLSQRFLVELATYTKAVEVSPSVQTPRQTARSSRAPPYSSTIEQRPLSSHDRPPSSPSPSSPDSSISPHVSSRNPTLGSPPTSFDQIQAGVGISEAVSRSNSSINERSGRSSSQDRISVNGFGPNTSQEKARNRGKARVGIVIGHIHLMAGQWAEATRVLADHTNRARLQSDHIWHGKGCEGIMVALLLMARAGVDFTIPLVCYAGANKSNKHLSRSSNSIDRKIEEGSGEKSRAALALLLPDLTRLILSIYLSGDGSLELPTLVLSEAHIRFSKLLTMLRIAGGELNGEILQSLSGTNIKSPKRRFTCFNIPSLSVNAISMLLQQACPTPEDHLSVSDRVLLLSGIASTYSLLGMPRKRGLFLKEIMTVLTAALVQARKVGAAEAGIHPAAIFSAEAVAGAVHSPSDETAGLQQVMRDTARAYGAELFTSADDAIDSIRTTNVFVGNPVLKIDVLHTILTFCEAIPDTSGIVHSIAAILRSSRLPGAYSAQDYSGAVVARKEEQSRLASMAIRTASMARHFGLVSIQAPYWDPFLVRDVELGHFDSRRQIIKRSTRKSGSSVAAPLSAANPFLYDRHASRPNTAEARTEILVQGEPATIYLLLQNPFDMSLDVESVTAWTEGVELQTSIKPFNLLANSMTWTEAEIVAQNEGVFKLVGFEITISGCERQRFNIFKKPWLPSAPLVVKEIGRVNKNLLGDTRAGMEARKPLMKSIQGKIIPTLPLLDLALVDVYESHLMLLDGERKTLKATIHNASTVNAKIVDIQGSNGALHATQEPMDKITIESHTSRHVELEVIGKAGITNATVKFLYASISDIDEPEHVRAVSASIQTTVSGALRAQNAEILPGRHDDDFIVSFDVSNTWSRPISFSCTSTPQTTHEADRDLSAAEGTLQPEEVRRIYLSIDRQPSTFTITRVEDLRRDLLDRVKLIWTSDERYGQVDLSGLEFSKEALERTRATPIKLSTRLLEDRGSLSVADFGTLRCEFQNVTTAQLGALIVEFRAINPAGTLIDDEKIALTGTRQRVIPPLSPDEIVTEDFTFCPLLRGLFEIQIVVKPHDVAQKKHMNWQAARVQSVAVGI